MEPLPALRNSRQSGLFTPRTWGRRDLFDTTLEKCTIAFLEFILMVRTSFFKAPQRNIEDTRILGVEMLGTYHGDSGSMLLNLLSADAPQAPQLTSVILTVTFPYLKKSYRENCLYLLHT